MCPCSTARAKQQPRARAFDKYMPLAELRDPARGFLRDDTLRISATLRMTGGLPENIIIKP